MLRYCRKTNFAWSCVPLLVLSARSGSSRTETTSCQVDRASLGQEAEHIRMGASSEFDTSLLMLNRKTCLGRRKNCVQVGHETLRQSQH